MCEPLKQAKPAPARGDLVIRSRGAAVMGGLIALAAIVFVAFPARVLEIDAVIYACAGIHQDLVQSTDAGHLIWGGVEVAAASWGRYLEPPLNPIFILRWVSIAAALAGAWLLYRLLARITRLPRVHAALLAGAFLFSYSYWHYGLQAEPRALHSMMLAAFLLSAWNLYERPDRKTALVAGGVLGLATLIHQTTILLVPITAAALFAATRRRGVSWPRSALFFGGAYAVVTILPYLAVGWFIRDLRTYEGFRDWILGLSTYGSWGYWSPAKPIAAAVGIVRSLVGSHFLIGVEPIRDLAGRLFPDAYLDNDLQQAETIPALLRLLLVVPLSAVLAGTACLFIKVTRRLREAWMNAPAFGWLLLGWLVIHTVFVTWWAPDRVEFWIAFWLPLIVLVAPAIAVANIHTRWLAWGLAALVTVNFAGSIFAQSSSRLEPEVLVAVAIDAAVDAGDVVLTELPLGRRGGSFIYAIDMVELPRSSARIYTVVDSLFQAVDERDRRLYWAGSDIDLPSTLLAQAVADPPVPVRADVVLIPMRRVPDARSE